MGYPKPLHWWTDNVLPLVYDESLSYYEVMSKIVTYINGITQDTKQTQELVEEIKELVENAGYNTIPEILARLDELDSTIASLNADNAQNKSDIANLKANIAELKTDNAQNKADIATLKTDNTQNKADIAELKTDNTQNIADITELKTDNIQNKADIAELKTDNTQNKADIANLKTDNTQNKSDIANLKTDNTQNKADITELKTDNTQNKADIAILKTDSTKNKEDITDLKSALNANTNAGGALDILQFETTGGKDSPLYVIGGIRYYFQNVTPDGVAKASAQLYVKGNPNSAVQIPTNGNKFSYLAPSSGILRIYCNGNAPGAVYLYMHGRVETEIEDINTKIGSSNMGTTATTVTGAVAEHTQNIDTASARIDKLLNSSGAISKLSFSATGSQDSGIFVKSGDKYTLENITPTDLTTIAAQIYVVGQSGSAVALGAAYGAKVTYTAPADGILRVYNTTSGGGNLHLYVHGYLQAEIDAIVDDINKKEYNLFSIFENFGACGDSLISGVIEGAQSGTSVTKYTLSWAAQLANICHNDYAHYSEGGLTAKAWLSTFGSSVASKDSYLVALGTNDYGDPNMPLGTNADIGTSAESFYRYYGDIVSLLKSTNPNAKIFLCSIYRGEGERVDWNNAIKYFADNYTNVYYVDFSNMTADFGAYKNGSHFSAMGYKMIAVRASELISNIIQNNFSEFRYVGF